MLGPARDSSAPAARRPIPLREAAPATALAGAALLVMAWLAIKPGNWGDWQGEARPAVDALMGGHVGRFFALAPAYGGSLILRMPFFEATKLWGGHEDSVYRAGVAPCLLAAGALALWLAGHMRRRGATRTACAVALLVVVANPIIFPALKVGHPEEVLGAVLCVAAVLCALADRPVLAGILLGLAVANKEWALIGAGPVLVALPRARIRTMLLASATAGLLVAPLLLQRSGGFAATASSVGLNTGSIFQPWQWWYFLGTLPHLGAGVHADPAQIYRSAPSWLGGIGHILPVALMPLLTGAYARLRRGPGYRRGDALLLLALVLALRCVLDPWDISYYSLPILFALTAWEAVIVRRVPVVALGATFMAWFVFMETGDTALYLPASAQALVFLLATVPGVLALAVAVFSGGLARLPATRPRDADPLPAAA